MKVKKTTTAPLSVAERIGSVMKPVTMILVLIATVFSTMMLGCERSVGVDNNNAPYLEVSISADTPAAANIPNNAVNLVYSRFEFIPHVSENIVVKSVVLTREGAGGADDFADVKWMADGVVLSGPSMFGQDDRLLMTDEYDVATARLFEAVASMNADTGRQNRICIMTAEDIDAEDSLTGDRVRIEGEFPVCGNYMTTTLAQVGFIHYTQRYSESAELRLNEPDQELITIEVMNDSTEDVSITKMAFLLHIAPWDVMDHKLLVNGTEAGVWNENSQSFDLSSSPFFLARGNSATFVFRGQVTYDVCHEFLIVLQHSESIAIGMTYGFPLIFIGTQDQGGPSTKLLTGNVLLVELADDNPPPGNVPQASVDFPFLRFTMVAGSDLTVHSLGLRINVPAGSESDLDDLKIWTKNQSNDWVVIAGPSDGASWDCAGAQCHESFEDAFDLSKCVQQTFMATMDVGMSMQTGSQLQVLLVKEDTTATSSASGLEIPPENILGNPVISGNLQTVIPP